MTKLETRLQQALLLAHKVGNVPTDENISQLKVIFKRLKAEYEATIEPSEEETLMIRTLGKFTDIMMGRQVCR